MAGARIAASTAALRYDVLARAVDLCTVCFLWGVPSRRRPHGPWAHNEIARKSCGPEPANGGQGQSRAVRPDLVKRL